MSATLSSHTHGGAAINATAPVTRRRRARSSAVLRYGLLPLCFVAMAFAGSYLARTELVLGPQFQSELTRAAQARGIDLHISSMKPVGLFGVRLEQVRARVSRGHYVVDVQMDAVEATPDILASLSQFRVVPGTVLMIGGSIRLDRRPERASATPKAASSTPQGRRLRDPLRIIGRDVRLELRAGKSFISTKPLMLKRMEAVLVGPTLPERFEAYGMLPDGVPFSIKSSRDEASGGRVLAVAPERATRLNDWFHGQLPFVMTTTSMRVCAGCARDEITLGDVALRLPTLGRGLDVLAPHAALEWTDGKAELRLPGVELKGTQDREMAVRLERTHFMFDTKTGAHTSEIAVREGDHGELEVMWLWDASEKLWSGAVRAKEFSLRPMLAMLEADPIIHQGVITGTLDGTADLGLKMMSARADLTIEDAGATIPKLSSDRLDVPRMTVAGNVLVDLVGKTASLTQGRVAFGDAAPIMMQGSARDARAGWAFDANIHGKDIDAMTMIRSLPEAIVRPVLGATLQGAFGFDVNVSGHTKYPESLKLDVDVNGDVQVESDAPLADIQSLAADGAPWTSPDSGLVQPTSIQDWVSYEQLPAHIPRTLLAAEDARFFKHRGFSWGGLRRAMVHNLKVGRMERGGSTITQQLIKNLYLSRQKTAVRKLQEAYLTWRIESVLNKERILEIYLNIAHWGPKLYGIRAAAKHYFDCEPEALTVSQTALLSTILPNPVRFGGQLRKGFIASSRVTKFEHIMSNLRFLGMMSMEDYRRMMRRAHAGEIGGMNLTICADDDTAPKGARSCVEVVRGS